jgi:hypothetical protein
VSGLAGFAWNFQLMFEDEVIFQCLTSFERTSREKDVLRDSVYLAVVESLEVVLS